MPTKLDYYQPKKLNPADELREILDRLEERFLRMKGLSPGEGLAWLQELDEAYRRIDQLGVAGLDLSAEKGRFQALQTRLRGKTGALLRGLGGTAALRHYRPDPAPSAGRWWWYIDELVARQRQHLWRRVILTVVIVAVLVGGIILAFNTILAPSPETLARVEAQTNAFTAVDQGNYRQALTSVEQGLAVVPDDAGLLIFKGVLSQALGEEAQAKQSFAQAQANLQAPIDFYLGRSQLELRLNQPAKAEDDARASLKLDEKSAQAWLLLAQSLELQEKRFEAVLAYEKAGDLALANGNNEVYVLARMALGRLGAMQ
jgi:tetratricopeptide (TPR) repeat protein